MVGDTAGDLSQTDNFDSSVMSLNLVFELRLCTYSDRILRFYFSNRCHRKAQVMSEISNIKFGNSIKSLTPHYLYG